MSLAQWEWGDREGGSGLLAKAPVSVFHDSFIRRAEKWLAKSAKGCADVVCEGVRACATVGSA